MARKTKEERKELAENIYWKMQNEGYEYWAIHYCNPERAPSQAAKTIMKKINKMGKKFEELRTELLEELYEHAEDLRDEY